MAQANLHDKSLGVYLGEIGASEPLSSTEEVKLAELIAKGNEEAKHKLITANLRFVVTVAREYQSRGLTLNELISAGNLGLIAAAERFDGTKGFKFISYAVWWIRQAILSALANDVCDIKISQNQVDLLFDIKRARSRLMQNNERDPIPEEIAFETGNTVRQVEKVLRNVGSALSLDCPLRSKHGDAETTFLERIPDQSAVAPDEIIYDADLKARIEAVLSGLTEREREVIELYFGLNDESPLTLEAIAGLYGLTRERVRQIKNNVLGKFRHISRIRAFVAYRCDDLTDLETGKVRHSKARVQSKKKPEAKRPMSWRNPASLPSESVPPPIRRFTTEEVKAFADQESQKRTRLKRLTGKNGRTSKSNGIVSPVSAKKMGIDPAKCQFIRRVAWASLRVLGRPPTVAEVMLEDEEGWLEPEEVKTVLRFSRFE